MSGFFSNKKKLSSVDEDVAQQKFSPVCSNGKKNCKSTTSRRRTTRTTTTSMRKRVQFPVQRPSLENHRAISRLSSRSLEEINAVWENEEEERARKEKLRYDLDRVANALKKGVTISSSSSGNKNNSGSSLSCGKNTTTTWGCDDDELDGSSSERCILGLEDKIGRRAEEKKEHREQAWDAVLWEQHHQWEDKNNCDYDIVAKVYREGAQTSEVQLRAQEVAKRLEEEMQAIPDDPEVLELLSLSNHSFGSNLSLPRSCLSTSSSCCSLKFDFESDIEDDEDEDDDPIC